MTGASGAASAGMPARIVVEQESLASLLVDDFSRQVLAGAKRVAEDVENPIRLNLFAAAVRELFGHTLHTLAPDANVLACGWYKPEPNTSGPTRRQRAKYATQGGLADAFIEDAGVDVAHLHDRAIAAINQLSKYTHVRPGVIVSDQAEVDRFVGDALSALQGLFDSFASCREEVVQALYDQIDREVVDAFISETLQGIDELATHHTIDEVYIDDLSVTSLTERSIGLKAKGSLGVELQWGSGSDRRRGEAAVMRESFRFEVTMSAPVDDLTAFMDVEHTVDVREWYGED